ncbi:MAG: tetratricopeptide repeat protein [Candidatus Hydrogenedentes bacterium]|nr:tetratricopeptide repeat protein [Candidatus Hydrogenedentota bacterium]
MKAWRAPAAIASALIFATFALYARTASYEFVNYDDPGYVYANPHVRAGLTADTIPWAFTTGEQGNWHPLTWLSHALDWELYGDWAGGHHLTSVGIHAITTGLLFVWLIRATGALWPSAIVVAIFGWHPLHVESVAWVSERKDVLCAFFFVIGLIAYTEYRRRRSVVWYGAVTASLVLALLSKPMAVTFPCVLLLIDVWPLCAEGWRGRVLEKLPWFAIAAAHSVVTYVVQQAGQNTVGLHSVPLHIRLENAAASYGTYAFKTLAPYGLAVHYPYPPQGPALWHWMCGAAFVLGGSILAFALVRRAPHVFAGWFWFVGMLVPVIGLVQVGTQSHADRYMYLPQIGLAIAVVWSIHALAARSAKWRAFGAAAAAVALITYPMLTWQLVPTWKHSFALFRHALDVTENNATAHVNLGVAHYTMGEYDEAAKHTEEALRIRPNEFNALINLGLIQSERQLWGEAERLWRAALALDPGRADAHAFLGQALEKQGKIEEAAAEYAESVRLDPKVARTHELLGGALLTLGRDKEAEQAYRRAIELDAKRAGSWASLGVSLCSQWRFQESLQYFERALELDAFNADARLYYARALASAGDRGAALEQLGTLLSVHPGHAEGLALFQDIERATP